MAPGFEPTTFRHELSPITTRPGLPPSFLHYLFTENFEAFTRQMMFHDSISSLDFDQYLFRHFSKQ